MSSFLSTFLSNSLFWASFLSSFFFSKLTFLSTFLSDFYFLSDFLLFWVLFEYGFTFLSEFTFLSTFWVLFETFCHSELTSCYSLRIRWLIHPSKHHYTQTVRARELMFWENIHRVSHVRCHVSCVTGQVSGVRCQLDTRYWELDRCDRKLHLN